MPKKLYFKRSSDKCGMHYLGRPQRQRRKPSRGVHCKAIVPSNQFYLTSVCGRSYKGSYDRKLQSLDVFKIGRLRLCAKPFWMLKFFLDIASNVRHQKCKIRKC